MNKHTRHLVTLAVLTLSSLAFAKQTKSEVKKEVLEEAKTASDAIKSACGCAVPVAVSFGDFETMTTNAHDDEAKPRYWKTSFVTDIKGAQEATSALCKDAMWKKKVCGVKKITVIGKGTSDTDFKYDPAKGVEIYTSEQMSSGGDIIKDRMKSALDN